MHRTTAIPFAIFFYMKPTVTTGALQVNFIENDFTCPYILSFVH